MKNTLLFLSLLLVTPLAFGESETHIFMGTTTGYSDSCNKIAKPSTTEAEQNAFISANQFCIQKYRLRAYPASPFTYFESPCFNVGSGYRVGVEKHFSAVAAYRCAR